MGSQIIIVCIAHSFALDQGEYFDDHGRLNTSDFGAETKRKKWFILFHVVIFSLITIMWAEAEWNSMRKILKLRVHTLPLLSAIFQCLPFVLLALIYLLYSVAWFDSHIKLLRVTSLTEFLDDYANLRAARDLDDYTKRKNKFILSRWVIISLFTAWFGWEFTKEFSILPELSFLSAFFQCLPYVIVALMYVFFSIVFFASFERAPKEDPLKIT
ncbi:hypothetical protein DKX38_002030 [Salix brachista]|uniref:Uncharacterized protein n=1 Tax=Salix brachista TaxID=2182728 RepID=A0A5N5NMH7_9ROSI|nr:hypothetical protein DKX38_002030 [Salix brachista]